MPRLSLYNPQKSNNYRYIDRVIKEMFTVGATDLLVHKYLGPATENSTSSIAIQDLLFLETRDGKYDSNVYRIRGHYSVQNLDFDLSQFGLFLNNDTIFITLHYNDMIDLIGRKLMVSDIFELPHLTDYHPLNEKIPVALRRYYQVTDANFASEGFSQTWYPHLWRIKCEPLVNSQQFRDILDQPTNTDNYMGNYDPATTYPPGYTVTYGGKVYTPIQAVPAGITPPDPTYWKEDTSNPTLSSLISTYQNNIDINDAIIAEAASQVPLTGYDRSQLYLVPTYADNTPAPPVNVVTNSFGSPSLGTGTVLLVRNSQYKKPSAVIKISSTSEIAAGRRIVLRTGVTSTSLTDTGSGRVFGDQVLVATLGGIVTSPYGTADNTFSTADQYPSFSVISVNLQSLSNVLELQEWSNDLSVGLVIRSLMYSSNGTPQNIFPTGTTIVSINKASKTITLSNPSVCAAPDGTKIEVAYDFTGTVSSQMDFRADCDPRFQYIRRASPRNFGYINGYLTGDGVAPNGEPSGHGITFPASPEIGEYFLRIDYLPQKLFRFSGTRWVEISQKVRTGKGLASDSQSQRASFVNESGTTKTATGETIPTRQSLSQALRIKPD